MQEIQEMKVWFLGWEEPLEKGMATHSGILAWEIPKTEEPGRLYSPWGRRVRQDWVTEQARIFRALLSSWQNWVASREISLVLPVPKYSLSNY